MWKWTAITDDHVIDLTALVVETRQWGGVYEKTKEGFNCIFVVSLHQIGAWRAFHRTPADMHCGGRAPAFRQTSLQAQKQGRRDLVGSFLGRGRVIAQDPCSVCAPGYTDYSRGSSPSSPWRVFLPSGWTSIKKGWNQTLSTSPHQLVKRNWEKGVVWKFGFHPNCVLLQPYSYENDDYLFIMYWRKLDDVKNIFKKYHKIPLCFNGSWPTVIITVQIISQPLLTANRDLLFPFESTNS